MTEFKPKASAKYTTCDTCGRLIGVDEGPTCAECTAKTQHEARSAAASAGWETRRAGEDQGPADDA